MPLARLKNLRNLRKTKGLSTGRKYKNIPFAINDILFQSIAEARRYSFLLYWEKVGTISDLRLQVPFQLTSRKKYIADFVYYKNNELVVEDVKNPDLNYQGSKFFIKSSMFTEKYGFNIHLVHPYETHLLS